jgi:hypothetical protein
VRSQEDSLATLHRRKSGGHYARVMGTLWRHTKTEEAGDAALGMLTRIWSHCADKGRPLLSQRDMAVIMAGDKNGPRKLKALLDARLLDRVEGGFAPFGELAQLMRERRGVINRLEILERDGWRCAYCACHVDDSAHVDHVVPWSRGGSDHPENLVASCAACNTSKGARTPIEWNRARASRGNQ